MQSGSRHAPKEPVGARANRQHADQAEKVSLWSQELRSRQEEISNDQGRVRENMKALRGSREERQLLQRYTRQLDEQETSWRRSGSSSPGSPSSARAGDELRKAIEALSFEMTPAR